MDVFCRWKKTIVVELTEKEARELSYLLANTAELTTEISSDLEHELCIAIDEELNCSDYSDKDPL